MIKFIWQQTIGNNNLWLYLWTSQKIEEHSRSQGDCRLEQPLESRLNVAKRVLNLFRLTISYIFEIFNLLLSNDSDKEDEKFYLKSTCDEFYWCLIPPPPPHIKLSRRYGPGMGKSRREKLSRIL